MYKEYTPDHTFLFYVVVQDIYSDTFQFAFKLETDFFFFSVYIISFYTLIYLNYIKLSLLTYMFMCFSFICILKNLV